MDTILKYIAIIAIVASLLLVAYSAGKQNLTGVISWVAAGSAWAAVLGMLRVVNGADDKKLNETPKN